MKKTIETLQNEYYWEDLYIIIQDKMEEYKKAKKWRGWNRAKEDEAIKAVADELGADVEDLKNYYWDMDAENAEDEEEE